MPRRTLILNHENTVRNDENKHDQDVPLQSHGLRVKWIIQDEQQVEKDDSLNYALQEY